MKRGQVLFLNEAQIRELLTEPQVLELVDKVLREWALGKTVNPVKLSLQIYPYHEGHINSMPSYIENGDLAGVKVVSVYANNQKTYGLPTTIGTIILHDADSGLPYAILGGTHITDLRTGAVSGVKARYLARKDSKVLAIVGAGAQGFGSMLMVKLAVPGIEEVRVCDLSAERRAAFIEDAKKHFPELRYISCASNEEASAAADIIVYATSASVPLLEGSTLKDGVTAICVSEKLTPKTIARFDGFYVDFTACAIERYNADGRHQAELIGRTYEDLTEDMVTGEIGDVMIGKCPGRTSDKQKILTAAVGMSIEDVIVARAAYDAAVERGVGTVLDLEN